MKMMELLSEHIEEELEDACTYIRLALEYRESDPELASLFYKLSLEEMEHREALHKSLAAHMEMYRRLKGEDSAGMTMVYDFLCRREMEKAEKITGLQAMFRK